MQSRILDLQNDQQAQAERERAATRQSTMEYNKQLASEKNTRRARDHEMNQRMDDMELTQSLNGGFLNETASSGSSNFKAHTHTHTWVIKLESTHTHTHTHTHTP
jgi:hypothetical protein